MQKPVGLLLPLSLVLILGGSARSQRNGTIRGQILTEDGQIAAGAVACLSERTGDTGTSACNSVADHDGRFVIRNVPPGTYRIDAENEDEGYRMRFDVGPQVVIDGNHRFAEVIVTLQGRGAMITASVIDAQTSQPIHDARVSLIDLDLRDAPYSGVGPVGDGHVASVPANRDLLLYVTAQGYKGWVYTDPYNPSRPVLHLAPGERKELQIELEKAEDLPASSSP